MDMAGRASLPLARDIRRVGKTMGPAEAGPSVSLCSVQLANIPASVRVAATARTRPRGYHHAWRRYRDAWGYHHAWRHSAAVVSVATATAIWATVKARATTTSNRNCQTGLCLVDRREGHGLGGGNAEETEADGDSDSKKLRHSLLPSCCVI
jgi:hypothetical protein